MLRIPEEIADGVVRIRAVERDDAPAYAAAFRDDPDLARTIGEPGEPDEQFVHGRLATRDRRVREGAFPEMAIEELGGLRFAGTVGIYNIAHEHLRGEVGFWLAPGARRRGLGTRAVRLMTTYGFDGLGLERIEMTTEATNEPTLGLARKLGFEDEGVLRERDIERGERIDIAMLAVLRRNWRH